MPLDSPIIGAGGPGVGEYIYSAFASADLGSSSTDPMFSSVQITTLNEQTAHSLSSLVVSSQRQRVALSAIAVADLVEAVVLSAANIATGDSISLLVDIIDEVLASLLGEGGMTETEAVLTINDEIVPIEEFDFEAPTGKLGSLLNVKLQTPDPDLVPFGANIKFEIKVTTAAGTGSRVYIEDGKLTGRDYVTQWVNGKPGDELTFSAIDVLADRFSIAPTRPITMFDPTKVKVSVDEDASKDTYMLDESGSPIMPILEPVENLSMLDVMIRAYTANGAFHRIRAGDLRDYIKWNQYRWVGGVRVGPYVEITYGTYQEGLGFDNVVTNLVNFYLSRADFSIEGGFHSGVTPIIDMFDPIVFVIGNSIYLYNIDQPLPAGVVPYELPYGKHKVLSEILPFTPDKTSVAVTYQYSAHKESGNLQYEYYWRDPIVDKTIDFAIWEVGYQETRSNTQVARAYYADDPDFTVAEYEVQVKTETWATTDPYQSGSGFFRQIHEETQTNYYEDDFKIGHHKVIRGLILVGGTRSPLMTDLVEERCRITWAEDPVEPGSMVQKRSVTTVRGLVYQNSEPEQVIDPGTGAQTNQQRYYPALVAQASGIVQFDWMPLMVITETITETLRHIRGDQYDVNVVRIDYLTGTMKSSTTSPKTGTSRVSPYEMRSRTILLRNTEREAQIKPRTPVDVNAFELPRAQALDLGRLTLLKLDNPPRQNAIQLPDPHLMLDRGSVVKAEKQDGTTADFVITGYGISGKMLGRTGHRISMRLETLELLVR